MLRAKNTHILLAIFGILLGFVPLAAQVAAPPSDANKQAPAAAAGGDANANAGPDTSEFRKKEAEALAGVDPATVTDIRRLLAVTNAQGTVAQVFDSQLPAIKENMLKNMSTDDPATQKVVDSFIQKMHDRVASGELVELIIPVYAKHFSHEDIKSMIAFFDSPAGRRFIEESPAYLQDVQMATAQHWQNVVVPELLKQMAGQLQELNIQNKQ